MLELVVEVPLVLHCAGHDHVGLLGKQASRSSPHRAGDFVFPGRPSPARVLTPKEAPAEAGGAIWRGGSIRHVAPSAG